MVQPNRYVHVLKSPTQKVSKKLSYMCEPIATELASRNFTLRTLANDGRGSIAFKKNISQPEHTLLWQIHAKESKCSNELY